nr:hypothetical protein [Pandoravirus aubagnensis]
MLRRLFYDLVFCPFEVLATTRQWEQAGARQATNSSLCKWRIFGWPCRSTDFLRDPTFCVRDCALYKRWGLLVCMINCASCRSIICTHSFFFAKYDPVGLVGAHNYARLFVQKKGNHRQKVQSARLLPC